MEPNKELFKTYLRKIGSGENTSHSLSRHESKEALELMLTAKATAAQIGAFMIAHRIRRPEPKELAGMLDAYSKLGPILKSLKGEQPPICFGLPFDGRSRTSPIYPLTTLILISAGQPVVLQGGNRMPVKYGVTTAELFKILGLNLTGLTIQQVQSGFEENGLALIHQPDHFPLAENLIQYRDEIGKRPPLASMELIWTAHQGQHLLVSGFVHPPTEARAWQTLSLTGDTNTMFIKGLEGSIDLPISRACITGQAKEKELHRLILHPRDHDCFGQDLEWTDLETWKIDASSVLNNKGALLASLHWNAGVYLWIAGRANNLDEGIEKAKFYIESGDTLNTLKKLISWRNKID